MNILIKQNAAVICVKMPMDCPQNKDFTLKVYSGNLCDCAQLGTCEVF